jgi:probable rRNA maturation factor
MVQVYIHVSPRYLVSKQRIEDQVERSIRELQVSGDVEVSVAFVGRRKIQELNRLFRHKDEVTDVLSFPLEEYSHGVGFATYPDGKLHLGDIVICYPVAVENAREYNKLVDDEIDFLVDHSIRHLMGIHHDED